MKPNQILKRCYIIITVMIFFFMISSDLTAQVKEFSSKDVPPAIMDSFKKNFPNAQVTAVEMEKEKGNVVYEIESMEGNFRRDIEFTENGSIIEIGEYINSNLLPESVLNYINSNFGSKAIERAVKKIQGSSVSYEVVVTTGKDTKQVLLLNPDGERIRSEDND